jgi:2'-5' RNA ligase
MESYKDYLIILSPSDSIKKQVKFLKEEVEELIDNYESRHSQAHISVKALRRQKPFFTEPLFLQMEKELSLIEPFTLQLNGFATFLPTDFTTIYAAIKSTPEMEDWFKRLRKILTEKKAVPHITIARQVPNDKAKKLWPKFKNRKWEETFEVTSLVILQRETFGYDKNWKPFKEILFRGNAELNKWVDKKKEKNAEKFIDLNQTSLF